MIEAVGRPETYKQAFYARDLAGRVVLVGVPTPEMILELPLLDVFGRGGSLKSSWYGDCLPSRDFPMLVAHYKPGNLDLDAFVSERITIDQVEEAFEQDARGQGPALRRRNPARRRRSGGLRMSVTIENLVTSGTFSPGRRDVGCGQQRLDRGQRGGMRDHRFPARRRRDHQPGPGPEGPAILLTHAHNDHIGAARDVAEAVGAPIHLNPTDLVLWEQVYPGTKPDRDLADGDEFQVAGPRCGPSTPPATRPGSTCFHLEAEGTVFTGDTLFNGGPGATGRSYSDYPTILASIRERLLTLPAGTVVRTGHGDGAPPSGRSGRRWPWSANEDVPT